MSVDAILVFEPTVRARLLERLAELGERPRDLPDGRIAWSTHQRYPMQPAQLRQFEAMLRDVFRGSWAELLTDPRGACVFSDAGDDRFDPRDAIWVKPSEETIEVSEADQLLQIEALGRVAKVMNGTPNVEAALAAFTADELERLDAAAKRDGEGSFEQQLRKMVRAFR